MRKNSCFGLLLRTYFSFAVLVSLFDLFLLIKQWSVVPASCFWSWNNCLPGTLHLLQLFQAATAPFWVTTDGHLWIILCVKLFPHLPTQSLCGRLYCVKKSAATLHGKLKKKSGCIPILENLKSWSQEKRFKKL